MCQLDKAYDPEATEDDMVERYEEMNRMREHVMNEVDKNEDRLISLEEFLDSTRQDEFKKDEGWEVRCCRRCRLTVVVTSQNDSPLVAQRFTARWQVSSHTDEVLVYEQVVVHRTPIFCCCYNLGSYHGIKQQFWGHVLQCFDTVGWVAGRASGLQKNGGMVEVGTG